MWEPKARPGRLRPISLAIALATAAGSASAQPPDPPTPGTVMVLSANPGGIGGGATPAARVNLALQPAVQKELKLTEAQKAQLKTIGEARQARLKAQWKDQTEVLSRRINGEEDEQNAGQVLSSNPAATLGDALGQVRQAIDADADQALSQILQPAQRARLNQIKLQLDGPLAFEQAELLERLKLAPEQIEEIQAILEEGHAALGQASMLRFTVEGEPPAAPTGANRPPRTPSQARSRKSPSRNLRKTAEDPSQATQAVRTRLMTALGRVLTRAQKTAYNKLRGVPFDAKTLATTPLALPRFSIATEEGRYQFQAEEEATERPEPSARRGH